MNQKIMPERTKLYWHLWIQYLAKEGLLDAYLDSLLNRIEMYLPYSVSQQTRNLRDGRIHAGQVLSRSELMDGLITTRIMSMAHRAKIPARLTDGMYEFPEVRDVNGVRTHNISWMRIADAFYYDCVRGKRPQKMNLRYIKQAEANSCSD